MRKLAAGQCQCVGDAAKGIDGISRRPLIKGSGHQAVEDNE